MASGQEKPGRYNQWKTVFLEQRFKEFPPRQKPGSFNLDNVMEAVTSQQGTGR